MALVSGVLLAEKATVARLFVIIALAGYLLLPLFHQKAFWECAVRGAMIFIAGLVGATVLWYAQWQWQCETNRFADGQTATVHGVIVHKQLKNGMWQYEVQPNGCRYRIIVCVMSDGDTSNSLGQTGYPLCSVLEVKGTFQFFKMPSNEGQFNEFSYQKSKGNIGRIYDVQIVSIRMPLKHLNWKERLFQLRQKLCLVYEQSLPERESGILASMVAGERTLLSSDVRDVFQHAGISHILAISGMHIQLIGMTVFLTLRKRKCPYLLAALIAVVVLLGYGGMIEPGVSSIRAIGMFFIYLIAACMGEHYDAYSALSVLVIILLISNPFVLHQTGFLFSCYAALSAIVTARVLREKETREKKLLNTLKMSLLLQHFTLPVVAYFYYEIPLYALFFNLLLLPFLGAVIGIGLVGGMIGVLIPAAAKFLLYPVHMIITVYLWVCDLGERLPYETIICGRPGMGKLIVYALVLWRLLCLFSEDRSAGTVTDTITASKDERWGNCLFLWRRFMSRALLVVILLAVLLYVPRGKFEIDFLDVGQGDGIYLHTAEGANLFIDGGSSSVSKVGTYRILPFLKYKGVRKIDYWFVSHPDADHINGLLEVLQAGYPVGTIITGVRSGEVKEWEKLSALAEARGITMCEMHTADQLKFEQTRISCLHPTANYETDDLNNASLVLLYEDCSIRAVFGGDISSEVEHEIIVQLDRYLTRAEEATEFPLCVQGYDSAFQSDTQYLKQTNHQEQKHEIDILKMNHHGSKYSNCEEWLTVFSPRIAVISCGKDNRYGHPHRDTLERLESVHSTVFRTDEMGQICIFHGKATVRDMDLAEWLQHLPLL
ncbi:MAG: ComEC/Rec2 family competence protein [bacterium]|nr:ComEC/Rec2 family competence protein [bacterium]